MKETSANRLLRIARRIFIDLASERIAARIAPDILKVAWDDDDDDYGGGRGGRRNRGDDDFSGGRFRQKFDNRGKGRGKGRDDDYGGGKKRDREWSRGRGDSYSHSNQNVHSTSFGSGLGGEFKYQFTGVSREFDENGVQFKADNATFSMKPNNAGLKTGVFFTSWKSGTITHGNNTFSVTNAAFALDNNNSPSGTFLYFNRGTIEAGGNKLEIDSPTMMAMVDGVILFRIGKDKEGNERLGAIKNAVINSPINMTNVDVLNAEVNVGGQKFMAKDASFGVNDTGSGLYIVWRKGSITSQNPVDASGQFENFTGRIKHGMAMVDCSDATFSISNGPNGATIDWKKGTWHDGVFTNGVWNKGTWENGRWCYGYWRGGSWKKGYQVLPKQTNRTDSSGVTRKAYYWDDSCTLVERDTPPTGMYEMVDKIDNGGVSRQLDKGKFTSTKSDWTVDANGKPLDPSLFPVQVIDELNAAHMYGETAHKGRNVFMNNVTHMWRDPKHPLQPENGQTPEDVDKLFENSDDIYRIYYDPNESNMSLYALYMNGRLKIMHLCWNDQKHCKTKRVLSPATHRPATIKDLYMLSDMKVFDDFITTPDGALIPEFHANDKRFPDIIVQKAVLMSKFKIFDTNYLDRLFFEIKNGKPGMRKNRAVQEFKSQWEDALAEITKSCNGGSIRLVADELEERVGGMHKMLTAMEKLQNFLKDTDSLSKKSNYAPIDPMKNHETSAIIEALNAEVNGTLTKQNLEEWMDTEEPAKPHMLESFDRIMKLLKDDAVDMKKLVENLK